MYATLMRFAHLLAERSTCARLRVGAVIASDDLASVLAIGYNGSPRGFPNSCARPEAGNCGCVHAEANALVKAPYRSGPLTLFTTHAPCAACAALIVNSAVRRVVYAAGYRDASGLAILSAANLEVATFGPAPIV
jgi:dCMP deaminase